MKIVFVRKISLSRLFPLPLPRTIAVCRLVAQRGVRHLNIFQRFTHSLYLFIKIQRGLVTITDYIAATHIEAILIRRLESTIQSRKLLALSPCRITRFKFIVPFPMCYGRRRKKKENKRREDNKSPPSKAAQSFGAEGSFIVLRVTMSRRCKFESRE